MSFETPGWGIAPPPSSSSLGQAKRKRPSGDDASSSAPPGASVNLEKLMAAMEREERDSKGEAVAKGKEKKDKNDKKSQEGLASKQAGGGPDRPHQKKPFEAKKPYDRKDDGQPKTNNKKDKKDFKKKDQVEKAPQVLTPKQVKPQKPQQQPKATTVLPDGTEIPKLNKRDARKYKAEVAAALAAGLPLPPPPAPKAQPAQAQPTVAAASVAPAPVATAAPSSSDAPMAAVQAQLEAQAAAAPVEAPAAPAAPKAATPAKANKKQKTDKKAAAPAAAAPAPAVAESPKKGGAVDENTVVMMPEEDLPARKELLEAGLTPMQAKMKGRLEGARFRWINEQLYTTSSSSALEMMKADPSVFADYHTGFRHQSHSWPQSPISLLLTSLQARPSSDSLIIDLGCGDAELAKTLVPKGYKVLSYDLVGDDWVTEADFCQGIPLPGGGPGGASSAIADAAVCCLSLMGRNWIGGVREVARVLKEGGIFEVAEITSRMPSVDAFIAMVVSLGFTLSKKDDSNTHFMMLSFVRSGSEPTWSEGGTLEWEDVLKKGEEVLKACVYKKR